MPGEASGQFKTDARIDNMLSLPKDSYSESMIPMPAEDKIESMLPMPG